ncbi:hypothetical protein KP77_09220 [Jeotgalibacillus alimentarius]|uniref:Uncharacterized protein n=1 Tax=Jeotgalibacillus alimentarius TaxID=135826 RepID=A0A0C2RMD0_9BACL|nr:hypothetical protein KP77_09220 [Jeotgalibacillus alimentarius]
MVEAFNWIKNKRFSVEPVVYKDWRLIDQLEEAPWNRSD